MKKKLAQIAEVSADIVVYNLLKLKYSKKKLLQQNNIKLKKFQSKKWLVVVSLGKLNGFLQFGNFILTGFIPALLKEAIEWVVMIQYKKWIYKSFFLKKK